MTALVLALPGLPGSRGINATTGAEPGTQAAGKDQTAAQERFRQMDADADGEVSRAEWQGSPQSFRVHDWNGDGVLSGGELRETVRHTKGTEPDFDNAGTFNDWSMDRFIALDRNRDGRINRAEWLYDLETFRRVDRNRDGMLIRTEFLGGDFDDDRSDRFDYLDVNGNNRVTRAEWHASQEAFTWLDVNRDDVLSRHEVEGAGVDQQGDLFSRLDVNRNNRLNLEEWQWSRASFVQLDVNRDGALTRTEIVGRTGKAGPDRATVNVGGTTRWIDTGTYVVPGDRVRFQATGAIQMSEDANDIADPAGSRTRRLASDAPLPDHLAGALIARIENGAPFFVGARTAAVPMRQSGRLFLSVNDDDLDDNRGELRVTVTVQRYAP
jgi:Ca2+-binding EF-hand superfamily protein